MNIQTFRAVNGMLYYLEQKKTFYMNMFGGDIKSGKSLAKKY